MLDAIVQAGHWHERKLFQISGKWLHQMRTRLGAVSEYHAWWGFWPGWKKKIEKWLQNFSTGDHCFSPLTEYRFSDGVIQVWRYLDRLMMHLILTIIRPTFKHIISGNCYHLSGPSAIKGITRQLQSALKTNRFHYVLRVDIRSYYASIDHRILVRQVFE